MSMEIAAKIARAQRRVDRANATLNSLKSQQIIKCPNCGADNELRELDAVVWEFYVRPYSCSGGDYWTEGDIPDFNINCPKCGHLTRYCDNNVTNKLIRENRCRFKSFTTKHKERTY